MTDTAKIVEIMIDGVIEHLGVPLSKDDPDREYYRGTLGAAYAAMSAAGLAIKSIEPTEEQITEIIQAMRFDGDWRETAKNVYKAMIAEAGK